MRSLRVLIAAILMVALCSVGSTAVADEMDTPPDSTSAQTPETPDPEPTPETPAPTEAPTPTPEPTKSAPSPDPEPTADPTPKNDSAIVPSAPKSSKRTAALTVADAFAVDDEYTIVENSVNALLDPSVTMNDTGIKPGSGFTHSGASHGLVVNTSGGFAAVYTYAPFADFVGDDTFTYTFTGTDDLDHTATVTIHVNSEAAEPHAVDDEYTVVQDSGTTLLNPDVTANDIGIPGVTLYSNSPAGHGTVTNSNPLNGHVYSYKPDSGFYGDDTFNYAFLDTEGHPHNATVTIHVTPLPGEAVDDEYTVMQDSVLNVLNPDVTANDTGIGEFEVFSHTAASHGFVSNAGPFGGGHDWAYSPSTGFSGDDTFEYTFIGNDGLDHTATVTIHVTSTTCDALAAQRLAVVAQFAALIAIAPPGNVPFLEASRDAALADLDAQIQEAGCNDPNDAPVAVDDSYTTSEDTTLTEASPGVLGNDTDSDGNSLTAVKATDPSHGTLTLNANGSLTYTPVAGFDGVDSFTYKTNDGTADSNAATVTITVTPTAPVPAAVDDEYTVAQGSGATLLDPDVYANDVGAVPNTFSHTGAPNGTVSGGAAGGHDYSYQPFVGFHGDDTFTYTFLGADLNMHTATVTVHVTPTVTPAAADDEYTVAQDSGATLLNPDVTANDVGVLPGSFSHTAAGHGTVSSATLSGSDFSYEPDSGYFGDDTFTYTFVGSNLQLHSATVTVHVTPTPSVAADDEYTVAQDSDFTVLDPEVTANDTGIAAHGVSHTSPSHGTVSSTNSLTPDYSYKPDVGFYGDDTFTYTFIGFDDLTHEATVTIHVTPTPSEAVDDEYTVALDSDTLLSPDVTNNDTGATGVFSHTQGANGAVTSTAGGHDYSYEPNAGFVGTDSFTYTFTGTDNVTRTGAVTIHVTPTPSVAADDEYTVAQDSGATLLSPDVTDNDTGATGVFSHTSAGDGTVTSTADGHDFSYEPDAGFFGDDSFTYTFTGTDNVSRTGTVTVHVTKTPLQAIDDTYTVAGDQPSVLDPPVTSNDLGLTPGVTTTIAGQPDHGTVTIDSSGNITYTPQDGYTGGDSFDYQLNPRIFTRGVAAAVAADLTGTVTLNVTVPGTAVGGEGESDDDDAATDSTALLPDTGVGIGSRGLPLALLLLLAGSGVAFVSRRGRRQI